MGDGVRDIEKKAKAVRTKGCNRLKKGGELVILKLNKIVEDVKYREHENVSEQWNKTIFYGC